MNKYIKTLYFFIGISMIIHLSVIYFDQIKFEWEKINFTYTEKQKEEIKVAEKNIEKVERMQHEHENKSLLKEHLEKMKEEVIKEIVKGKEKKKKGGTDTKLADLAPGFTGFTDKSDLTDLKKYKIKLLGNDPNNLFEEDQPVTCDKFYIGIGLSLNVKGSKNKSKNSPNWSVDIVAAGYGASKAGIKKGDIFLGLKDFDGTFYEGNFLIAGKSFKENDVLEGLFVRNGVVISKDVKLSKICYDSQEQRHE